MKPLATTKQVDALESVVTDILKNMELVEFAAERDWDNIPARTLNSIYNLTKAAFDLYFDIEEWRTRCERREKSTTATIVRFPSASRER